MKTYDIELDGVEAKALLEGRVVTRVLREAIVNIKVATKEDFDGGDSNDGERKG